METTNQSLITPPEKIKLARSDLVFRVHYPEENPDHAIESITDALAHNGLFDAIKKLKK